MRRVLSLARSYDAAYARLPVAVAFGTCFVKATASDTITQTQLERKPSFDAERCAKFGLWGGLYCGCAQHVLYNTLYPRWFGAAGPGAPRAVILRTFAFELGVHFPLVFNPVYYICNSLFTGASPLDGLRRYAEDFFEVPFVDRY